MKEKIIMVVMIIILLVVVIGVSYASFSYSGIGSYENKITTGEISMSYQETSNVINMNRALPTTDTTGKASLVEGEYFDFSVTTHIVGDTNINWEISAKALDGNTFDGSNIRLYLTRLEDGEEVQVMAPTNYSENSTSNSYTGRPANEMSLLLGSTSEQGDVTTTYRLRMWVDEDYNPQGDTGGKTFAVEVNVYGKQGDVMPLPVVDTLLAAIDDGTLTSYDDGTATFITGEEPNNYIWYSGKLWRAVSVNNADNTTKLVTQWNISTIPYNSSGNTAFDGSHMEMWLNDTSVDGFLGNLRNYQNFIVTDARWNATQTDSSSKPAETTMVTDAVGLLNYYEYVTSYRGTTYGNGYLNNGLLWWTLTPYSSSDVRNVIFNGSAGYDSSASANGVRPSINLKSSVTISGGDGTANNPYRLAGDNDSNLSGTLLNTRYSGEYITFGTGENNLYRIVSHETTGLTKITSAEPLKDSGAFKTSAFGSNTTYSSTNTIGTFLNGEYLTSGSYLSSEEVEMIEDSSTWYLGTVGSGVNYRLAKYTSTSMTSTTTSTTAQVGLLRLGELMAGQFERYAIKGGSSNTELTTAYWLLSPYSLTRVSDVFYFGTTENSSLFDALGIRPSMNLKSNVVIASGDGTLNSPFVVQLGS